ncbi:hypothetical protein GCM10009844_36620 [Nocardioides koreensis]|uniref:Lipopolysaccharide assembly protein A domain-containing protein n=1 Tax=Nocardioides koreensis TaxID=433651 RepID=A0ABN3A2Z7_9ACTN
MSDASATPPTEPATEPTTKPEPVPGRDPLRGSRTSGIWVAVVGLGVVLLLLIIFIAQNTQTVNVSYFGWDGEAPLAVTLLIATAAGLFLAAVAGSLRILQLRRRVRREKRH